METLHSTFPLFARPAVVGEGTWSLEPGDDIPEPDERPGILVIDEDVRTRAALRAGLEHQGFRVWLATSGREAVDIYRRLCERVALVLVEARMSDMDGPETLTALRAINPALPCCFMTSGPRMYGVTDLRLLGAARVFTKPFDVLMMAPILRQFAEAPSTSG